MKKKENQKEEGTIKMGYGMKVKVDLDFFEAVGKVKEELTKEGFGVLTEIDVKSTLKKKLDVEYEDYVILGACNPSFAYGAFKVEKDIGLLLPCNVVVYVEEGKVFVSIIDPIKMMSVVSNSKLNDIAKEVGEKLKRVLENLK